jgi:hypothetical protein
MVKNYPFALRIRFAVKDDSLYRKVAMFQFLDSKKRMIDASKVQISDKNDCTLKAFGEIDHETVIVQWHETSTGTLYNQIAGRWSNEVIELYFYILQHRGGMR